MFKSISGAIALSALTACSTSASADKFAVRCKGENRSVGTATHDGQLTMAPTSEKTTVDWIYVVDVPKNELLFASKEDADKGDVGSFCRLNQTCDIRISGDEVKAFTEGDGNSWDLWIDRSTGSATQKFRSKTAVGTLGTDLESVTNMTCEKTSLPSLKGTKF